MPHQELIAALGVRIIFDANALKDSEERLFPLSRNRSARIQKKLIKRFGGEYRREPCIWQTPHGIIAHPTFKAELARALNSKDET